MLGSVLDPMYRETKGFIPQVRLELTTPALLKRTVYKYRALTDCATGEMVIQGLLSQTIQLLWQIKTECHTFCF